MQITLSKDGRRVRLPYTSTNGEGLLTGLITGNIKIETDGIKLHVIDTRNLVHVSEPIHPQEEDVLLPSGTDKERFLSSDFDGEILSPIDETTFRDYIEDKQLVEIRKDIASFEDVHIEDIYTQKLQEYINEKRFSRESLDISKDAFNEYIKQHDTLAQREGSRVLSILSRRYKQIAAGKENAVVLSNTIKLCASLRASSIRYVRENMQQPFEKSVAYRLTVKETEKFGKAEVAAKMEAAKDDYYERVDANLSPFELQAAVKAFWEDYRIPFCGMIDNLDKLEHLDADLATDVGRWLVDVMEQATAYELPELHEWRKKHKRTSKRKEQLKESKQLPVIRTKKATERTDAIDKITHFLPANIYGESPAEIAMEKKGSENRISAFVSIIPDENITPEMAKFDAKDVVVLNGIYSIFMAGNNVITDHQIFDVIAGGTGTKKQLEDIRRRVYRYIHYAINMDVSAEAVALGYARGTKLVRSTQLIPGEMGIMQNVNGQITTCLVIHAKPPILWYAEKKGQILRYPVNMLDVGLRNTDDVIVLKNYLASRVRSRLHPVILYETIYKQLGNLGTTPGAIRKKKVKIRDMVKKIMEQFKKQGEITKYANVSKGKEIYSISFVRA